MSLSRRREDGERGAVMVEFALVAMVLVTLAFGTLEYGYGWRSSMNTLTAARAGARSLASSGTDQLADYLALSSIRTNLDSVGMLEGLQKVIFYKSTTADGVVPAGCVSGAPGSNDRCNVYSASQVQNLNSSAGFNSAGCMTAATIKTYCPNIRVTAQGTADSIGVWVQAKQKSLTGFFGGAGFTASRTAVMRLEPA